jgi:hypothetical protein
MAGRGVDRLCVTGGRPVAPAIAGGTEVRAALEDLARNADLRLARIRCLREFQVIARDSVETYKNKAG